MKKYVDKDALQDFATKLHTKQKTIFATKGEVGTPLVASLVADMTDETKIYVYVGSESGYTAGNWYYYDGSAWTSGGVYNSAAVQTDTTLSVSGMAADAKTVGDDLDALDGRLDTIEGDYVTESEMTAAISANIAPEFSASVAYAVGDYVLYQGDLYRFVAAHAAGAWDATDVVEVTVSSEIECSKEDYTNLAENVLNSFVFANDFIYGRYIFNGFADVTTYARNSKAYPPGVYEVGPSPNRSYIVNEYVSDTQGNQITSNWTTLKQTITANRPFYISFSNISGDSDIATINSDFVVRRVLSTSKTLQSQIRSLESNFEESYSANRFDGIFTKGGYVNNVTGAIDANANYSYSDYVDISNHANKNVIFSSKASATYNYDNLRYAFYNADKEYISGGVSPTKSTDSTLNRDYTELTTPQNAFYIRFSETSSNTLPWVQNCSPVQIEYGTLTEYSDYTGDYKGIATNAIKDNPIIKIQSSMTYGKKPSQATSATFTDGQTLIVENNSVMKNQYISFFGNITGSFDAVIVGHGQESYGYYVKVDGTNLTYGSNGSWGSAVAHGLTITDFVGVIIEVDVELNVKVTITTKGGHFTRSAQINSSWRGNVFATSDGTSFTDAVLTWNTDDYKCPFWAFGDSYFTLYSDTRWPYYICNKFGFNNVLLNAYPGENSENALNDFTNALKHGMPKYVLWCMGMNDPDSDSAPNASWLQSVNTVRALCEANGVELILSTIPIVTNTTPKNTYKNAWIRDSGLRYVDFATALANVDGWLSEDGVHPSEIGGRYMALMLLADVPEIAQGK